MSMTEIARFTGGGDAIELNFVDRIHTPIDLMEYAVELYLNELSLSNTVIAIGRFGVKRAKSTIHNRGSESRLRATVRTIAGQSRTR